MPERVIATREIHQGKRFRFEELSVANRDPDQPPVVRDIVRHPGAVVVLPILDGGRYVMTQNFRVAVEKTLWELCAGTLDREHESPMSCAKRELIEETGYSAGRLDPIGSFYTTPGLTDELMHAFVASDLEFVGQSLEPGEEISVCLMGPGEVDEIIESGELMDAKSLLTIFLYRAGFEKESVRRIV